MKKANFTTKAVSYTLIDADSLPNDFGGYLGDLARELNRCILGEEIKKLRNKTEEMNNGLDWAKGKFAYATENRLSDAKEYKAWERVYTIAVELCEAANALIGKGAAI